MERFIGYGSLVNESSARMTCPDLKNFSHYWMHGFRRVFGLVAFRTVTANPDLLKGEEISACYIYPDKKARDDMLVCAFEVPEDDAPELRRREFEYYEQSVNLSPFYDSGEETVGNVFVGYGQEDLFVEAKGADATKINQPEYYAVYQGPYYRNDITPCRRYFRECLSAYQKLGDVGIQNFINTSYLANGMPLREFLQAQNEAYLHEVGLTAKDIA